MEVSQIYRTTNVKVLCHDQTFMDTLNLLEIELSSSSGKDKAKPACREKNTGTVEPIWGASSSGHAVASLDVTAAFWDAPLPHGRVVVMGPPTILYKL